jgi:hypothetical protein
MSQSTETVTNRPLPHRTRVSVALLALSFTAIGCAGEVADPEPEDRFAHRGASTRIAVIGAGPSGLTAALTLKERGYKNVTVFERENHVGGKVSSLQLAPGKFVEMGAVFASDDYPVTLALADKFNIPRQDSTTARFIYDQGTKYTAQQFLFARGYDLAAIQEATRNYRDVLAAYPEILDEKLSQLAPELLVNFDEFAIEHGIVPIAELAQALVVGFGYGYYDNVPAIYILKIINMLVKVGPGDLPASPRFITFPGGFQSLWVAVAAQLDVRLSSNVTKIDRRLGRVYVTINNERAAREFDVVIVSAPLSAVPKMMSLTAFEETLFKRVTSSRYLVSLVTALGVTGGQGVFVHDHAVSSALNHVGVWANPDPNIPVFQTWQISERAPTQDELFGTLAADLTAKAGATVVLPTLPPPSTTKIRADWPDYFPRVNASDMWVQLGPAKFAFFDLLEILQGFGGVYYVGSSMSFETVETSAAYAKRLVEERFPSQTRPLARP